MRKKQSTIALLLAFVLASSTISVAQNSAACGLDTIIQLMNVPKVWSPDGQKFLLDAKDTSGVYQIYVGTKGSSTLTCISASSSFAQGNCCGLFRSWDKRNKMQANWEPSGQFIVCGVEKEYYNELLTLGIFSPATLEGLLACGTWMDIWAVTPDGSKWTTLASVAGFTGVAFTPDGKKGAYAEARDSTNFVTQRFGRWNLKLADFQVVGGVPSFTNIKNINPAGSTWIEPGNFSPDGKSLLVSSDIGLTNAEGQDQFIVDITNGNVTNVTPNSPQVWDEHGVFSPDGKKIIWMSSYPYRADTNSYHTFSLKTEFMLMNSDGTGVQQLTHFNVPGYPESGPNSVAAAGGWAKDGTAFYGQNLFFPYYKNWEIRFKGDCGNDQTQSVQEKINANQINLYPNPATNEITVAVSNSLAGVCQLQIVDMVGRVVQQQSVYMNQGTTTPILLDIETLPSGLYTITIGDATQIQSTRFVKE